MIVIIWHQARIQTFESHKTAISAQLGRCCRLNRDANAIGIRIHQGRYAGLRFPDVYVIRAHERICHEARRAAEESDEPAARINRGPITGRTDRDVVAEIAADEAGRAARRVPKINAGGCRGGIRVPHISNESSIWRHLETANIGVGHMYGYIAICLHNIRESRIKTKAQDESVYGDRGSRI